MLGTKIKDDAIEAVQQDFVVKFSTLIKEEFKKLEKTPSVKGLLKFEKVNDGLDQMLAGSLELMFEGAMTQKSQEKWVKALNQ